jgi:hypothetical protein
MFSMLLVLLVIILVLGGVAVAVVWLLTSSVQASQSTPGAGDQVPCPSCGRWIRPTARVCWSCNFPQAGPVASELADLAAMNRQLERFRARKTLDETSLEQLENAILLRRRNLQRSAGVEIPEPAPIPAGTSRAEPAERRPEPEVVAVPLLARPIEPSVAAADEPATVLPWRRLERLLEGCTDVEALSPTDRVHAMLWLRQSENDQLARMAGPAQVALARLLRSAGRPADSLRAFWRALDSCRDLPKFEEIALEAGRFALEEKVQSQARWFFQQALARSASSECRQEVESLLRRCEPAAAPAEEEILTVLPVVAEPVVRAERRELPHFPAAAPPEPVPQGALEAPPLVRRPRRSFLDLLTAFMEERNILWGEVVGGLLIVGCSFALAVHLANTQRDNPYLPPFLFATISAALIGAGLYTLRRWKLDFTSRGLLVDGLLMVPLVFPFVSNLISGADPGTPLAIAIAIAVVFGLIFTGLVCLGAHVLVRAGRWLLPLVVMGAAVSQVALPLWLVPDPVIPGWHILVAGGLPVACFALAGWGTLRRTAREGPLQVGAVKGLFAFLGISLFAVASAVGFQVKYLGYWGVMEEALELLATPVAIAGIPILATGLLIHRRLAAPPAEVAIQEGPDVRAGQADEIASLRTVGTALALAGMLVMLAAVGLAWPLAWSILVVCALDFGVLTFVAFRANLPVAHAAALPCLLIGFLTAFLQAGGYLPQPAGENPGLHLLRVGLSAESAAALVALVVILIAASESLTVVLPGTGHGKAYGLGAAGAAALSLMLVTYQGAGHALLALAVYGAYGAGCLTLNLVRWRRPLLSHVGLGLLCAGTLWALRAAWPGDYILWAAVLATEAVVLAVLAAVLFRLPADEASREAGPASLLEPRRDLPWFGVLMPACRDLAGLCALLGLFLALLTRGPLPADTATYTGVALTAASLLLAWTYGAPILTWVGSTLLLWTLFYTLPLHFPALALLRLGLAAPLLHASIVLAAGLEIRHSPWQTARLREIFAEPLRRAALVSSLLAFPFLVIAPFDEAQAIRYLGIHAAYLTWLGAIWLVLAWVERRALLFTAFQLAVSLAVLFGVGHGLMQQEWFQARAPASLLSPWALQAFGIGLGLLGLAWVGGRIAWDRMGRGRPAWEAAASQLLPWALDRVVLGVLICGQFSLAIWGILPGVSGELTPPGHPPLLEGWPITHVYAYGAGAWLLLGLLAVVLIAALWDRRRTAVVIGMVLVGLTVPVLAAGPFEGELATASALRWGLGLGFVVSSALVWLRGPLARTLDRFSATAGGSAVLPVVTRYLLLLGCVAPVLVLTLVVAILGFSGTAPSGPAAESAFARVGWVPNHVIPLLLVSGGLVGYALRERLPGFAFAAGLLVNVTVMGGYALGIVTGGEAFGVGPAVVMVQLGTIAAALWTIAWVVSRWWVDAWREEAPLARPLMAVQLNLPAVGNILLLLGGVGALVLAWPSPGVLTVEGGSVLGWLALGLAVAAGALHRFQQRQSVPLLNAGILGLAALGLLACSIERGLPGWGYRALLVGWADYALVFALSCWQLEAQGGTRWLARREADLAWVPITGLLVMLLGLRAAIVEHDHLWAAGAILLAGSGCGVIAVWKRHELWALPAALGANLAVSLVVWYTHFDALFEDWWVPLLQANQIVAAVLTLGWLWLRQRQARADRAPVPARAGLTLHLAAAFAANLAVLVAATGRLLAIPDTVPAWFSQVGHVEGWLAVVLGMAAVAWYVSQLRLFNPLHAFCLLTFELGVLAACAVGPWDDANWLAYHVLLVAWGLAGVGMLAAGWSPRLRHEEGSSAPLLPTRLSYTEAQSWLNALGSAVVLLAVRGAWEDPGRPWWSASATLGLSVLYAALAVWSREARADLPAWAQRLWKISRPLYVDISGLLINVTGTILWVAWGPRTLDGFLCTTVICLALASAGWSIQELALRARTPPLDLRGHAWPFSHVADLLALGTLAARVAVAVGLHLAEASALSDELAGFALAATALAVLIGLWDREAWFARAALYTLGLVGLGLLLHVSRLAPPTFFWTTGLALGGYVLLTTVLSSAVPALLRLGEGPSEPTGLAEQDDSPRSLPVATASTGWPEPWFLPTQVVVSCVVLGLSLWMAVAFGRTIDRLGGPLAATFLIPAGVLAVTASGKRSIGSTPLFQIDPRTAAGQLRYATLALGVVAAVEASWASLIEPGAPAAWLHRTVLLMVVLAAMTVGYGVGLARLGRQLTDWADSARRLGPVLGILASLTVLVILAQEAFLFDATLGRAPMLLPAAVAVAVALIVLIAGGIAFAVLPGSDPFGLPERGRTFYVYAGEVLMVLLYAHLRLTMPQLFHHINLRYVPFLILGIAYLGVALSELFRRQGLRVLAEPLQNTGYFLPVIPVLAFWALPAPNQHFADYALLWFLVGSLFAAVALVRRSFRFALVAALSANCGLWVLLYDNKLSFLTNPQLWLIPGALIALVAEHLNRDRLTTVQSNTIRYLALIVIYVSSTAEMFLRGLAEWPLGPVVLAVLAVLGVLAGMLLRVRAFLLLGVLFLVLDIITEVCHAATRYTWIWWASGIVLGVAILTLFALFEKRRNDMLRLIEALKKWQ